MYWEDLTTNLDYRHYIMIFLILLLFIFVLYLLFKSSYITSSKSKSKKYKRKKPKTYEYSEPYVKPEKSAPIEPDKGVDDYLDPPSIEPGDIIINNKKRSKGEMECKRVMEEIYGVEFPTVRPKWLINPKTGKRLELDGYSFKHRIAFEYNGRQHRDPKSFGQGEEKLREQQERDRMKLDICDRKGIYVITIPDTTPIEQIRDYILYYQPENRRKRLEAGMTE